MLENENNILFESEIEYTYPEYKKHYFFTFKYTFVTPILILLVMLYIAIKVNTIYFYMAYLIMVAIVFSVLFITKAIGLKRGWESKDKSTTRKNKYTFYKDRFEVVNNENEKRYIYYRDIYTIGETQKYLYIEMSRNRFFVLNKQNCNTELLNILRKYRRSILEVIRIG